MKVTSRYAVLFELDRVASKGALIKLKMPLYDPVSRVMDWAGLLPPVIKQTEIGP